MPLKMSVITVCMNSEATIKRCVNSVKSQKYEHIEHIIIDGGSTDKTLQIIQEEANSKSQISSESDFGIYNALNKGLRKVTGDLVCFLHSDDEFASINTVGHLVEIFKQRPELDLLSGHVRLFSGDKLKRHYGRIDLSIDNITRGMIPAHTGMSFSTSSNLFKQYYDESYTSAGDFEYLTRLLKLKPNIYYSDKVITNMQLGGKSTSGVKSYIRSTIEIHRALEKNGIKFNTISIWIRFFWKLKQYWLKR